MLGIGLDIWDNKGTKYTKIPVLVELMQYSRLLIQTQMKKHTLIKLEIYEQVVFKCQATGRTGQ